MKAGPRVISSLKVRNIVKPQACPTGQLIALQRYSQFVGRTTNWLYDHLRFVPRHKPFVLCDALVNRDEFPDLDAWCIDDWSYMRRVWRRLTHNRFYPNECRTLKRLEPCVLHSHFGGSSVHDRALQQSLGIPWVVSFYGADVYQGQQEMKQQKYARLFDKAARVLVLGPMMKQQLERLGCPGKKIVIHPLGVDVRSLPSEERILTRGETLRVLFAGTFREKKGLRYLIDAAALARRAGVRLHLEIVGDAAAKPGDAEAKDSVLRRIGSLGLEEIISHHGYLKFRELVALALRSQVFVAPSVTASTGDAEGTPFVLQQMMATGMPVISTIHSDIPYLFGDYKDLLVPERDSRAIADRLQRYAEEPDTIVANGMAMRERICDAFDARKCAGRLSDLYDAL
jgi:colanic acid/amylovoran biosynthesis glycosyltransferase